MSVDETYVGGKWANMKKSKRTKLHEEGKETKVAVMGLMEREGRVKLTVIGKNSFKDVVRKNVDTKAIVVTDEYLGYRGLNDEFNGHVTVNHSQLVFVQDGFTANNIEGFFSLLKRSIIGIYHQVSLAHLHRYCNEASYRYNTRKIKDLYRFMDAMQKTKGRLRYKDLIKDSLKKYTGFEFVRAMISSWILPIHTSLQVHIQLFCKKFLNAGLEFPFHPPTRELFDFRFLSIGHDYLLFWNMYSLLKPKTSPNIWLAKDESHPY